MTNVVKKLSISCELAQRMVNAAVTKAREPGVTENVAILDDGVTEALPQKSVGTLLIHTGL